ncbi:MAG: efflux RND transporter periplasmic adaptor subunit [Oscillospiraceae bacterium]
MKRIFSMLTVSALALGLLSGCAGGNGGETVPVESVSLITGVNIGGMADSYAGKVVSGETAELKKDDDKTVLEVLVEEGDMVSAGDVLFSYDTEAMQLSLDKLYLDRESLENTVSAAETEIAELERQKKSAPSDQQLSYTLQINSREADIREAEYNMALKDKEIEAMENSMENTEITSPISGRVMSVGSTEDTGDVMGDTGTTDAFITVMDISAYRVEGYVNELNRGAVYEGLPVCVRSRVDETAVWYGTITAIDWEKPVSGNNNNMYYSDSGNEMTSSSQYPFYVVLDNTDGLLLGEHVYIEPELGGGVSGALMLPAWYIVDGAYVWAADGRDKLEKREVELGVYDEYLDQYEILSGLDYSDYIAFPDETLSEGMDVVYYDETSFGGGESFEISEDFYFDDTAVQEGAVG